MFGGLRGRDLRLFLLLVAIGAVVLAGGWFGAASFKQDIVKRQAKSAAITWGEFIRGELSQPAKTFGYGKITKRDRELMDLVTKGGNVFRYRFYNREGTVVLASRRQELGKRSIDPLFQTALKQRKTQAEIEFLDPSSSLETETATVSPIGAAGVQRTIARSIVPVMDNQDRIVGAIEVYVDATKEALTLGEGVEFAKKVLIIAVAAMAAFGAFFIWLNVHGRNREFEVISRAHESLSKAEEEVIKLNEELEHRVEGRTAELNSANEDIRRLNSDLERRVEERTEQLYKTNEQLYKAVENANRLNEDLELRVDERTAELNKANEQAMRLNAELEIRVTERTAELNAANEGLNKANEDVSKLNADLEARVTERTAELNAANENIRKLNTDLEQRVADRTSELEAAQAELLTRERLAALGQLTATVSHELRNPLGAIRTAVYLISTKTAEKGLGVEDAIKRAERSITRCDNIINELLDFTRQTPLALENTSFDRWIDHILEEQGVPDGITLHKELQTAGLEISFDQERLRRVMINVLGNACEAMREEAEGSEAPMDHSLTVRTLATPEKVQLIARDTGPGIPPDKLEKIFEPLFSTKSFGVGLGLPIVRQIMEQHGGGIDIASVEGEGTTVSMWLPVNLGEESAAPTGRGVGERAA